MSKKGGDLMESKEYEYDRYEVKLSRFMNIQQDFVWCLGWLLFFALLGAVNVFVYGDDIQFFAAIAVIYLIAVVLKLRSNPRRLEITRTTVNFQHRRALLTLLLMAFIRGRVRVGCDEISQYTENYTIYNIKSMEYLKTSFEKIFSCGHIRICGDVNIEGGKKEERTFTIYGVKHFDDISAWMKDFMILSSDRQQED